MEKDKLTLNANDLVTYLKKPSEEFTKVDIINYIQTKGIKMVNFLYPGGDGKIKTLNFVISDLNYLKTILTYGERVDGSSLFDFIPASNSDLYVLPRFSTAFVDPFAEIPTIDLLCTFFDKNGKPLESSPEHTLTKAATEFTKKTSMEFQAMGELEYYVIMPDDNMFPSADQKAYHESGPFAKTMDFRMMCMQMISQVGGQIKYGHTEVGTFKLDGLIYEQNEIEFLPVNVREAADQLMLAKWIIRNLAYRRGLNVTFAPKITTGKAGSGLHIHMRMIKDGKNMMLNENKTLSDNALRMIAGLMDMAPSITAFGNKNPTSYFRLVPHQEAPTNICWGISNRSALVRVPLGWTSGQDMSRIANPNETDVNTGGSFKQTIEIRSADGSADIYQLLAGICVACRHGFEMTNALEIAKKTFIDVNIHDDANTKILDDLKKLPDSCVASARCLNSQREVYEHYGVFSKWMIDGIISQLRSFNDLTLRHDIEGNNEEIKKLVKTYFNCG
jgi:glutamine synthetase